MTWSNLITLWLVVFPLLSIADPLATISDFLKGGWGQINTDLRFRYEYADQEGNLEEGNAATLRLRLGYLSPTFHGFQALAEMEANRDLGLENFNSLRNGKRDHAVVADPQAAELNRLWLSYNGLPDTLIKVGRQRIIYDDHRFIGNVPWRQMEQTFDAVRVTNQSIPGLTVDAAFLWRVQNIVSRTIDVRAPLIHLAYDGLSFGKIGAYAYLLDYDDRRDSVGFQLSSQTYGMRFDGKWPVLENFKLIYGAEYARQMDYQRNPNDYSTDYYRFTGGVSSFGVTLKGNIENLTADHGIGFSTPLATLHAFQGWADKFLTTPAGGIRDVNASVGTQIQGIKFLAVYHDFHDENGRVRYGEEYDVLLVKTFGKHLSVLLKYAYFNAIHFATDTQKVWGQVNLSF